MATTITPRTLKGFRDYLPADMAPRQAMIRAIEDAFARHGFVPIDTPALEYAEILAGKYGEEGDKLLYQFKDHGDRDVALRYDLTVPLARLVGQHRGELQLPLRRYHVAPVWRADKPQRGRFREFMQCDADIVGSQSALADAEILVTGLGVLQALGLDGAQLHLNHRQVLFALLEAAGVRDEASQLGCVRALDKLDKIGNASVKAELGRVDGVTPEVAIAVLDHFDGGVTRSVEAVRALVAASLDPAAAERHDAAFERLTDVLDLVEAAGFGDTVVFDPTIARGLDYYTGIIYETRLTDPRVASMGAVMSGGRYDSLIGMFSKEDVPAVGISVGLDRLLAALNELERVPGGPSGAQVYVTVFAEDYAAAALRLAQTLRRAGLRVEVHTNGGKLGKQLGRAGKRGCRFAIVAGPDEAAEGVAVLRDLEASSQDRLPVGELAGQIQARLDAPAVG